MYLLANETFAMGCTEGSVRRYAEAELQGSQLRATRVFVDDKRRACRMGRAERNPSRLDTPGSNDGFRYALPILRAQMLRRRPQVAEALLLQLSRPACYVASLHLMRPAAARVVARFGGSER